MMQIVLLRNGARARVWLADPPDCRYTAITIVERSLPAMAPATPQLTHAAIEVFVPYGAMAHYGLLGAELIPQAAPTLLTRVAIAAADGAPFTRSLAHGADTVRIGLPLEYAQSVLDGVFQAPESQHLGGGRLEFACAAHGVAGSAPIVFRNLAKALVTVLAEGESAVSREKLTSLLLATS